MLQDTYSEQGDQHTFNTSCFTQFRVLFYRTFISILRDTVSLRALVFSGEEKISSRPSRRTRVQLAKKMQRSNLDLNFESRSRVLKKKRFLEPASGQWRRSRCRRGHVLPFISPNEGRVTVVIPSVQLGFPYQTSPNRSNPHRLRTRNIASTTRTVLFFLYVGSAGLPQLEP